jgi:hypothetical protein
VLPLLKDCTSTATYLPVSDSATTASTALSLATITRTTRKRPPSGANRMRSFCPSRRPPSRPRAPKTAASARMSSGGAPRSRRIVWADSPFFTAMARSFQASGLLALAALFGSSVMFSGTMRASKPA